MIIVLGRSFIYLCLLLATSVQAADIGFLSFDLPQDKWGCSKEATEWICTPKTRPERTQAMIVMSAKLAGPEDNLKLYMRHLKEPKMLVTPGRTPAPSQVIHAKMRTIGPQEWVESLHLASEVPGFYTLYLATRAGDLSVLVTLSAAKSEVEKFNESFGRMTQSLRLNKDYILKSSQLAGTSPPNASDTPLAQIDLQEGAVESHPKGASNLKLLLALAFVIGLAAIGYSIYQSKS